MKKNRKVNFNNIKSFRLLKEIGSLEKGLRFNRSSKEDLFTAGTTSTSYREFNCSDYNCSDYEECIIDKDFEIETVIEIHQKAIEDIFKKDKEAIKIIDTFKSFKESGEKKESFAKELENVFNEIKNNGTSEFGCAKSNDNSVMDLSQRIRNLEQELRIKNTLLFDYEKEINKQLNVIKDYVNSDFVSELKYEELKNEIKNLIIKYQNRLNNIEILDELELDKIEEGTVLENMITLLTHLNKY